MFETEIYTKKKKGKYLQFGDFGIVAGENIVTGRHPSIGGDHTVIGSGDGHTRSTQQFKKKKKKKPLFSEKKETSNKIV